MEVKTYEHIDSLLKCERCLGCFPGLLHQLLYLSDFVLCRYLLLLHLRYLFVLLVLNVNVGFNKFFEHLSRGCLNLEDLHLGDGVEATLPLQHVVNLIYNVFTEFSQVLRQLGELNPRVESWVHNIFIPFFLREWLLVGRVLAGRLVFFVVSLAIAADVRRGLIKHFYYFKL